MSPYSIDYYRKSADYILEKLPERPQTALVLGSSLGSLGEAIQNPVEVEYKDIPNFLVSTVESHAGKFVFGTLAGKYVACMSGRFHYYEGYAFEELAAPMRVLKLLGVKRTILTNAAGAVNEDFKVGDIMLIRDHIKFASGSPMRGSNIPEFGPRFFDVTGMYSPALRPSLWPKPKPSASRTECGRVCISISADPSSKPQRRSGPPESWARTRWACPPLPKPLPPLTAVWISWGFPSLPTWPPA